MLLRLFSILLLLIAHRVFGSDQENNPPNLFPTSSVASFTGPSTLVNGSVCVVTGDFVDSQTDIVLAGPEPLVLRRNYSSSDESSWLLYKGWSLNHPNAIHIDKTTNGRGEEKKKYTALLSEPSGAKLLYKGKNTKERMQPLTLQKPKGLTNLGDEAISARTNMKNQTLQKDTKQKKYIVKTPAGSIRTFEKTDRGVRQESEESLSGHQLKYIYRKSKVKQIAVWNKLDSVCYSHATFDYDDDELHDKALTIKTSDGRKILYQFDKKIVEESLNIGLAQTLDLEIGESFHLVRVTRPEGPQESFKYNREKKICRKDGADGRYIEIDYYRASNDNNVGNLYNLSLGENDPRIGRVKTQRAPVGVNGEQITTHRFVYNINTNEAGEIQNGSTDVYDAHLHKISYHYDGDHHLTAVEKFTGKANDPSSVRPYSIEGAVWGAKNTPDESNLLGTYLKDTRTGHIHSARYYDYDSYGNITKEWFYGNLSGVNPKGMELGSDGKPSANGCESYCKEYEYTQDDRHLLACEMEPNGKKIAYSYKPNTDLIVSKMTLENNAIRLRQFYEYNDVGVVNKIISDDGSSSDPAALDGVTERRITYIYPRKTAPVGVPERTDEFYLDLKTGQEVLLKRVFSDYFLQGRLRKQDHYDNHGVFQYSLKWDYDAHGNLIKEVNAIEEVIIRKFDDNNNLIYEQGPSQEYYTDYHYDLCNRLFATEEVHNDGTRVCTSHTYDYLGNRTKSVDRWGNATHYDYDEFGRVVRTIGVTVVDEKGNLVNPETTTEYDIAGNPIVVKDAKGHITLTTFNARGKPTSITHPDGTKEQFIYNLDGTLQQAIAPNGTVTKYSYDFLGRVESQEVSSANGKLLSCISSKYNGFHLERTTDAEGNTTVYDYDGAGRLIATTVSGHVTNIEYDNLGRIGKKSTQYGESPTEISVEVFKYDFLNRVIEERIEDTAGQVLQQVTYHYDVFGNRNKIIKQTEAGPSTTEFTYNSQNRLVKTIDPLENTTHINYLSFYNPFSQHVLQTETSDPLGNITIATYDTMGRIVSIIRKNSFGILLAKKDLFFDVLGNKIKVTDSVVINGNQTREYINLWDYNAVGQITYHSDGYGTTLQKNFYYTYDTFGQKESLEKPDGIKIKYHYDPHGRVESFDSSDKSIDYAFVYNRNHQVVECIDNIQKTTTSRDYDNWGLLESETLGNALKLVYEHDPLGRCKKVTLPDQSQIAYAYDAAHLKEVQRIIEEKIAYTHTYNRYDLAGRLLEATCAGSAGKINLNYDLHGQVKQITSRSWKQQTADYDQVGNLRERSITDSLGHLNENFSYDDLYQLKTENGVSNHTYASDSINNRTLKDDLPYTINDINQIKSQGNSQYSYDLNGNLARCVQDQTVTEYRYDALDRLVAVIVGDNTIATYVYDAFNRRLSKTTGNIYTKYIYQNQNEIGAIVGDEITELRLLGLGKGAEIGSAVALELNQQLFIPVHDHNGNVMSIMDSFGKVVETYRYTAFGEEQIYDALGNLLAESSIDNPWRFSSKRIDEETGFLYFGRRYYSPDIGRWVTPDPIGYDAGPNLYAYVHNNPLTFIDLYGLVGEAYRDSCDTAANAPRYRHRDDSGRNNRHDNSMFEDRSNRIAKNTTLASLPPGNHATPHYHEKLSTKNILELYDDSYFDREIIQHSREYLIGTAYGASILASEAVGYQIGAAISATGFVQKFGVQASKGMKKIFDSIIYRSSAKNYVGQVQTNFKISKWRFPNNPNNLLKDFPRDNKGNIYINKNLRIRPEQHGFKHGDTYNPRHHGQHFHFEIRRNPNIRWQKNNNVEIIKPPNYQPGSGTGFLPGEFFPEI